MTALVRMRLVAFVRAGRALAPLLAGLLVLLIFYGGGPAPAHEAYGVSAVILFPVLAWQSKLLLDAEPDVQRRLARVALGPGRELVAGVLAAALLALLTVLLAVLVPWLTGGIRGPREAAEPSLAAGVVLGVWAHLLALLAGVALGALASRAVTRRIMYGVAVLATGAVLALVLGLSSSFAPWLAPPLMATARALLTRPTPGEILLQTGHAIVWSGVLLAGYGWLRRTRS